MKKILSTISGLLFSHLLFSQATVTGKVMSASTKETLIGVSVIVADTIPKATTDIDGAYSFTISPGKHTILFKMIGMTEKKINVELSDKETKQLTIFLEESAKELGTVVVSAGKFEQKIEEVTVSMSVVKPSLVENKNTTSMDDILDQVPSVNIIDGQANIRGGSGWSYGAGSRVLILVDELPMLTADAGDVKWNFLPVENMQQMEVIKGSASALYGSSAMNGVINIRTAYPKATPETKINVFSGVYNTHPQITLNDTTYDLNWSGSIAQRVSGMNFFHSRRIKNFDLVVGGNMYLDDGYRQGEYENRARFNFNTRYRFKNIEGLSCGVNFNTQNNFGSLFFLWQNDTTGSYLPQGGTSTATTTLSDYNTYRTNVDPFITYVDKSGGVQKIRTRYFRSNNENNTNQGSIADLYYGEYQYQKRVNDQLTLTGGLVGTWSVVKSELYGDHKSSNGAAYVQADAHYNKFNISLGGRVEKNKIDSIMDDYVPVLRAGINYHLFKETYIRTSFGQGYRYPAIAEKFVSTSVGMLTVFPNDSLSSEKSISAEVGIMQGLKIGGWQGYFDVAAFYTEYRNMIEFTFSQWGPPYPPSFGLGFQALNIGNTRIKGVDLSLTGTGTVGPFNMTILAGYTYMDPRQVEFDSSYVQAVDGNLQSGAHLGSDSSDYLKYRYTHLVRADVELDYRKLSFGVSMRYNSVMKNIDKIFVDPVFGALITPGVAHYMESHKTGDMVFDFRTSYQFTKNVKLAFIVKNAFNYIYMGRPADMQPPRLFTTQLTVAL